jgi:CBS domain-containing protein
MEITTTLRSILNYKGRHMWSISPEATVYEAIEEMADKNIGALVVIEAGHLVGLISERDYTRKVVLNGRSSRETRVSEIMTRDPITISPHDSVERAMLLMTEYRVRHLPVLEGDELLGLVSIGDLVNWIISAQTVAIEDLEHFVTGAYPV